MEQALSKVNVIEKIIAIAADLILDLILTPPFFSPDIPPLDATGETNASRWGRGGK
ncbi:MAG: hypothetical protein ACREQP_00380 [Candidatus Binatia bacterium]